jgi:hypothetical protein
MASADQRLWCTYHHADLRIEPFGSGFDLVMMVYGQFNVFPRNIGQMILEKAAGALAPGGCLLLEIQSAMKVQQGGEEAPSWYVARSGLFISTSTMAPACLPTPGRRGSPHSPAVCCVTGRVRPSVTTTAMDTSTS